MQACIVYLLTECFGMCFFQNVHSFLLKSCRRMSAWAVVCDCDPSDEMNDESVTEWSV